MCGRPVVPKRFIARLQSNWCTILLLMMVRSAQPDSLLDDIDAEQLLAVHEGLLRRLDAAGVVAALSGCVDTLIGLAWDGVDGAAVVDAIPAVYAARERLVAVQARAVREADRRDTDQSSGHRSSADELAARIGCAQGEALGLVRTARRLGTLPATEAALAAGTISEAVAREAADSAGVTDAERLGELDALVAAAGGATRRQVRDLIADWRHRIRPEDLDERDRDAHRRRRFREHTSADGMGHGSWSLPLAAHAQLMLLIRLHEDRVANDDRSPDQRRADALVACVNASRRDTHEPHDVAGLPARVLVTRIIDTDGHDGDDTPFTLDGYGPVGSATARLLACDAETSTVTITRNGKVFDVARADGDPSRRQRLAVIARDRACVGCGASASRCQVHHVHHRSKGGPTRIDNLCLTCWSCHDRVHHRGWTITRDPSNGRFAMRPPDRPF